MEVRAIAKYVKVQPRKVRIVADEVRGKNAIHAAALLRYHPSKSAAALRKVLVSAMANAQENHNVGAEALRIATIMVDEGPRQKRIQARAMGRGNRILKKTAHITVVVEDSAVEAAPRKKPAAKARPSFGAPAKAAAPVAAAPVEEAPVEEAADEAVEATPVSASDAPEQDGQEAAIATPAETASATETEEKN